MRLPLGKGLVEAQQPEYLTGDTPSCYKPSGLEIFRSQVLPSPLDLYPSSGQHQRRNQLKLKPSPEASVPRHSPRPLRVQRKLHPLRAQGEAGPGRPGSEFLCGLRGAGTKVKTEEEVVQTLLLPPHSFIPE